MWGSLTRGSLHLDDLDRKPCIVEVEATKGGIFTRHNVPVREAKDAFKIEEAVRENEDSGRMIEIVEKMKAVATSNWSGMTLIDKVAECHCRTK